ncbi:histidinol dehydrogenase [Planktosalinus lacus]|uniref:Histidinol dehydrogenase n=1 Tax=Planktosalinus lacus TaxID=1526573 RepID=A0A8J2VC82_9FLAO|nr:histidinol dehydrogenase [Planktosalinus lacus]GGD96863.1 histidinol dehydrogenase [Planktosalinus lacus]
MQKIQFPNPKSWAELSKRPLIDYSSISDTVQKVFQAIQNNGDESVRSYTNLFDAVEIEKLQVTEEEIQQAVSNVPEDLQQAIQQAAANIETFHKTQIEQPQKTTTTPGVVCWRESRPIDRVGIYIPGGTAPLFSTVLMLGIPAKIAGCPEIVLCTPPDKNGNIHPAILYTAQLIGITKLYKVGGIQAIGAMTFGTESIPRVDKIFGPGNQYVTAAKQLAQNYGVAIDMPAGPSEVLVIADASAVPAFVAADLLSQAEHGTDSQVMLLSDNETIIAAVLEEITIQLEALPRKQLAAQALLSSKAILFNSITECINFSNQYAPEHLILAIENYTEVLPSISNAGSVFLGNYSCESAGDYASGTNHTLPTNGYARNYSGVSLDSFVKKITFQELNARGIKNIGPAIELMAAAEELQAHKNAVTLRLKRLENE